MRIKNNFSLAFSAIILSLIVLFAIGGCTPLKKKFTRENKKDPKDKGFIPVLDPIQYPQASVSPEKQYKLHYSLWRVWHTDLMDQFRRDGKDKKQEYLINQMIVELTEMKNWTRPSNLTS